MHHIAICDNPNDTISSLSLEDRLRYVVPTGTSLYLTSLYLLNGNDELAKQQAIVTVQDELADYQELHHLLNPQIKPIMQIYVCQYSGLFYCEGFLDEKMPSWFDGHSDAFDFFDGVPAFIIPDNCATAVDRQHYDEKGILNSRYVEFFAHYGAVPKPTRIKKPRGKGHVERHVRIVETDIIRPMERLDI